MSGKNVFVLLLQLSNDEWIPMGTPGDEVDALEAYSNFAYATEEEAISERADLIQHVSDYEEQTKIVPGTLSEDGTLEVDGRVWSRAEIEAEHGITRKP